MIRTVKIVSVFRVFQNINLKLFVMSANLDYRERERQRKLDSRRQASEAQREKERQTARARDKNKGDFFLLEEQHENFVTVVRK